MTAAIRRLVEQAAALWREASYPVAFTGAGVSVPSGIPDFRSPDGLWSRYDPFEVASVQALYSNPRRVWEFLLEACRLFDSASPNPAHTALADLENAGRLKAVITQNIDNLHQAAGSRCVVEFHGNGRRFYCMGCKRAHPAEEARKLSPEDLPWLCGYCGRLVRPDVVFFGEHIPPGALRQSMDLVAKADLALVAGTSGEVAPANSLPYEIKARGGRVIEINLGRTAFGDLPDVRLDAPVEEALPSIRDQILGFS